MRFCHPRLNFRALTGAAPLKPEQAMNNILLALVDFRALTGAAPLKSGLSSFVGGEGGLCGERVGALCTRGELRYSQQSRVFGCLNGEADVREHVPTLVGEGLAGALRARERAVMLPAVQSLRRACSEGARPGRRGA